MLVSCTGSPGRSKSGAPSFIVEVRGVFLETFLFGVFVVIRPAGVLGVAGVFETALRAEPEWKEGVTSLDIAVLSAWRLPKASSIMFSTSKVKLVGVEVTLLVGVLVIFIEGDRSNVSVS